VRWAHSPATKVSMLRDSVQMFLDVVIIRWNALRGRYRQGAVSFALCNKVLDVLPPALFLVCAHDQPNAHSFPRADSD